MNKKLGIIFFSFILLCAITIKAKIWTDGTTITGEGTIDKPIKLSNNSKKSILGGTPNQTTCTLFGNIGEYVGCILEDYSPYELCNIIGNVLKSRDGQIMVLDTLTLIKGDTLFYQSKSENNNVFFAYKDSIDQEDTKIILAKKDIYYWNDYIKIKDQANLISKFFINNIVVDSIGVDSVYFTNLQNGGTVENCELASGRNELDSINWANRRVQPFSLTYKDVLVPKSFGGITTQNIQTIKQLPLDTIYFLDLGSAKQCFSADKFEPAWKIWFVKNNGDTLDMHLIIHTQNLHGAKHKVILIDYDKAETQAGILWSDQSSPGWAESFVKDNVRFDGKGKLSFDSITGYSPLADMHICCTKDTSIIYNAINIKFESQYCPNNKLKDLVRYGGLTYKTYNGYNTEPTFINSYYDHTPDWSDDSNLNRLRFRSGALYIIPSSIIHRLQVEYEAPMEYEQPKIDIQLKTTDTFNSYLEKDRKHWTKESGIKCIVGNSKVSPGDRTVLEDASYLCCSDIWQQTGNTDFVYKDAGWTISYYMYPEVHTDGNENENIQIRSVFFSRFNWYAVPSDYIGPSDSLITIFGQNIHEYINSAATDPNGNPLLNVSIRDLRNLVKFTNKYDKNDSLPLILHPESTVSNHSIFWNCILDKDPFYPDSILEMTHLGANEGSSHITNDAFKDIYPGFYPTKISDSYNYRFQSILGDQLPPAPPPKEERVWVIDSISEKVDQGAFKIKQAIPITFTTQNSKPQIGDMIIKRNGAMSTIGDIKIVKDTLPWVGGISTQLNDVSMVFARGFSFSDAIGAVTTWNLFNDSIFMETVNKSPIDDYTQPRLVINSNGSIAKYDGNGNFTTISGHSTATTKYSISIKKDTVINGHQYYTADRAFFKRKGHSMIFHDGFGREFKWDENNDVTVSDSTKVFLTSWGLIDNQVSILIPNADYVGDTITYSIPLEYINAFGDFFSQSIDSVHNLLKGKSKLSFDERVMYTLDGKKDRGKEYYTQTANSLFKKNKGWIIFRWIKRFFKWIF